MSPVLFGFRLPAVHFLIIGQWTEHDPTFCNFPFFPMAMFALHNPAQFSGTLLLLQHCSGVILADFCRFSRFWFRISDILECTRITFSNHFGQ